jgi:transmembrane sensor
MSKPPADHEAISAAAARWVARRDAGLTDSEQGEFERWRAVDARHDAAVRHFSAAWSALDRPLRADAVVGTLRRRIRRRRQLGAATAVAALCLVLAGVWPWRAGAGRATLPLAVPGGLVVAPEKRVLQDGTLVELKGGAEIAVAFTATLRCVTLLKGEAHFQVARNERWPFAVDAGGVQVRAVGTAFSVERDAAKVEVVVTEGRVAVEKPVVAVPPDAAASPSVELSTPAPSQTIAYADAGQRVVLSVAVATEPAAVVAVSAEEIAERLAWRAPRVEFSGTPLAEAVAMMNRSVGTEPGRLQLMIDAGSAGLAKEPISGIFRADNTETFVRMLELSLGVQVERRGNHIVLKKR